MSLQYVNVKEAAAFGNWWLSFSFFLRNSNDMILCTILLKVGRTAAVAGGRSDRCARLDVAYYTILCSV